MVDVRGRKLEASDIHAEWMRWRDRTRLNEGLALAGVELSGTLAASNHQRELGCSEPKLILDTALFHLWLNHIHRRQRSPGKPDKPETQQLDLDVEINEVVSLANSIADHVHTGLKPEERNQAIQETLYKFSRVIHKKYWQTVAGLHQNLIRYIFYPDIYLRRAREVRSTILSMLDGAVLPPLEDFIQQAAMLEIESAAKDQVVALGAWLSASYPHDDIVQSRLAHVKHLQAEMWTDVYATVLDKYNCRITNPAFRLEDFTRFTTTLVTGAITQARVERLPLPGNPSAGASAAVAIRLLADALRVNVETKPDPFDSLRRASQYDLSRFLRHVGFAKSPTPDLASLTDLQAAFLDNFSWTNLDLFTNAAGIVNAEQYLSRLIDTGHGGLCFQLNYSFALVLRSIGFEVDLLLAAVTSRRGNRHEGNHLTLRVTIDGRAWLVDVGLGDGPRRPIPLVPDANIEQGPFKYRLEVRSGRWYWRHDQQGTFQEFDFENRPAKLDDFVEPMVQVSQDASWNFAKSFSAIARREEEVLVLRGRQLFVYGAGSPRVRRIENEAEFWEVLLTTFGIWSANLSRFQRVAIWQKAGDS